MSTLPPMPAAVKSSPANGRRFSVDQIVFGILHGLTVEQLTAAVAEPEPIDTTDHAEPFNPTPDDAEWWAGVVDHCDWPRENELNPEEQDAELERLDRYNDALEAMYADFIEAERIERYAVC